MEREGTIVSYTAEELDAMRARGEGLTDWAAVAAKTEEQLAADTASDPAWDGIPEDWYKHARARRAARWFGLKRSPAGWNRIVISGAGR